MNGQNSHGCRYLTLAALLLSSLWPSQSQAKATGPFEGQLLGVLPISGSQRAATEIVKTLRGYEGLSVISLAAAKEVLGAQAALSLSQCADDACRIEVLRPLNLGMFVHGEFGAASRGRSLRLRLVSTSSVGAAAFKVTVNQSVADDQPESLRVAIWDAVASLFAESGLRGFGSVRIESVPDSASVTLNDELIGLSPIGPVRIPQGKHKVVVSREGYKPWAGAIEVRLGETAIFETQLVMNRNPLPVYLVAGAISSAVTGLVFGLHASTISKGWSEACTDDLCADGFSAQRHFDETRLVDNERTVANGMFAVAIGMGISAATLYFLDDGYAESTP
jgi:hypothetical protein